MRITFVLPVLDLSGGNRVLSIYADRLRRRGHAVSAVAVCRPRPRVKQIIKSLLKRQGWPQYEAHCRSHFDGLDVGLRRLNHSGPVTDADLPDADVVIASWWETAQWVARLAPAKGVKVHFIQGYDIHGGPKEQVDATYALPLPKIVISGWLRQLLETRFHQSPVAIVHNSVDTEKFRAPPRGKQQRPTVGMIYATDHYKGCDIGLKAFALASRRLPDLHLVTMGYNQVSEQLPLPAGAEYTFQARDQQVRDIYAGCDVWLFCTREEGFGLPILEAMACRTPVVGTPAGAAAELLSKGGGILIPHDDPEAMADALVQVCTLADAQWRTLSDAALATAAGHTWDDAAAEFEKALEQIVEAKKN